MPLATDTAQQTTVQQEIKELYEASPKTAQTVERLAQWAGSCSLVASGTFLEIGKPVSAFDYLVIGLGGITLAWHLRQAEESIPDNSPGQQG